MKQKLQVKKDDLRGIKGRLSITIRKAGTKEVVRELKLDNLITNNFRTQILHVLAGNSISDRYIDRIQVGTNGTAVDVSDVAITAPVDVTVTATYPITKSVQFVGTLGTGDGNGVTFQEVGLIFHNVAPNLVARRVFSGIAKTSAFEWDFTWVLQW